MIKLNDHVIEQDCFGDGTLKCALPPINSAGSLIVITWCYDNDAELFTLWSLVCYIRDRYPDITLNLAMPYIPHARQDREVSHRLFTLKYFAKLINAMNFRKVFVLDPHSDVSLAVLDKVVPMRSIFYPDTDLTRHNGDIYAVMYPDAGAAKKYGSQEDVANPIIGNKHRNEEGRIDGYELLNFVEGTKNVIIRDDICSYGGTFVAAAKELKKRGVEKIILYISHCENNILKGEVLDWVDMVYTTDSICTVQHPKIQIIKSFREGRVNVQD